MTIEPILLPGVPRDAVMAALGKAAGKELESGKFNSPESSAALAVNTFGWFIERPQLLPQLPGAPALADIETIAVEYCARFPWSGGRHPWLDAMIQTREWLIGVESKRFEPFRDKKRAELATAYDRRVWGNSMQPFEHMRDLLRAKPRRFELLDAAQLVKHAFGLVTDAKRRDKRPHLHYLYAEPPHRAGIPISMHRLQQHRREIDEFASEVRAADVTFSASSYREWLSGWQGELVEVHAARLLDTFAP